MNPPHYGRPFRAHIDWRWAIPRIAAVFLVTRLLALTVAFAVETTQPAPPEGIRVDDRPILASLTVWDGTYYVGIAEDGYDVDPEPFPEYAFYPLFPLLTRAASLVTLGDITLAAVIVSNLAFALALIALYALSVRYLTPERAVLALWFLALAPGAIAFALSYPESLFLLLAVSAFLAAETRHTWLAGGALALATLARPTGILLLLPLLALYIQRDGWRPTRDWRGLLLAPLATAGLFGYLWWLTGDPLARFTAQSYWNLPAGPSSLLAAGEPAVAMSGGAPLGMGVGSQAFVILWLGCLLFYSFLFVYFRHDRIRPAYLLVAVMAIVGVFMSGGLQPVTRHLAVAWPFDWVLANRSSRIGRALVLGVFAVIHVGFLWLAFTWRVPP